MPEPLTGRQRFVLACVFSRALRAADELNRELRDPDDPGKIRLGPAAGAPTSHAELRAVFAAVAERVAPRRPKTAHPSPAPPEDPFA